MLKNNLNKTIIIVVLSLILMPSNAFAFDTAVIDWAIKELCGHITGHLGGLLVTVAAFGALVSAALGSFRVTYSAIIVAVGAYAITSIESLYFDDAANICAQGATQNVGGAGGAGGAGNGGEGVGGTDGGGDSGPPTEGGRLANPAEQTDPNETDPFVNVD